MKLQFFGPLGRVTGSCALLSDERLGVRILVDAGMQQGEGDPERWNRRELPFDASSLTHVVLTHAHIDHCGLLPRLFKDGFEGKVLCTPETAALAQIELEDSARVSRAYSVEDARRVRFDARESFGLGGYFSMARDVFLQFFRTSHILGAVSVRISWGPKGADQRSIIFSGDLGTNVEGHERFLFLGHRMAPQPSTYAVVESTYGDRIRAGAIETFEGRTQNLARELRLARERGGTTLIASFAMDRLQSLMLDLAYLAARDAELAATPTFVHAPLGKRISSVYARFVRAKDICKTGVGSRWLSRSAFGRFGLDPESAEDERRLEDAIVAVLDPNAAPTDVVAGLRRAHEWTDRRPYVRGPHVVLASSGMLEGGPVTQYLPDLLADSSSTLLLTGFASPTTVAGQLLALGPLLPSQRERLSGTIVLPDGSTYSQKHVRARIVVLGGYSGHADQRGLVDWLVHEREGRRCAAGQTIFIQHGDDRARESLRRALLSKAPSARVVMPTIDSSAFDLDGPAAPNEADKLRAENQALRAELARLRTRAA